MRKFIVFSIFLILLCASGAHASSTPIRPLLPFRVVNVLEKLALEQRTSPRPRFIEAEPVAAEVIVAYVRADGTVTSECVHGEEAVMTVMKSRKIITRTEAEK